MKNKLAVLCFCLFGFIVNAQIKIGLENNSQWYIDDDKIKLNPVEAEHRFRSNTYLKGDYDYKYWSFGLQLESYAPQPILNYSPYFKKFDIGTVSVRYNNVDEGIDISGGHFYEQYGAGLILRSWEDRQIGINNAIFGINAKFNPFEGVRLGVLGGKQRVGMGFDLADSYIGGSNLDLDIASWIDNAAFDLNIGGSYVVRFEEPLNYNKNISKNTNAFSVRADYAYGGFYIGSEYVLKQKDVGVELGYIKPKVKQGGNALLLNLGYSQKGLAFNANLRRIENMSFYSQRDFYGNEFNKGIINYIPALTKQYDYSLQNIYVYQAQTIFDMTYEKKLGEMGGQFDFYYDFKKGTTLGGKYGTNLVVNGSYWAAVKYKNKKNKIGVKSDLFSVGNKYYSDLGIEVRKKWTKNWSSIFMYLNQDYNGNYIDHSKDVKSNIVSAETTFQFLDNKSVRLEAQHLWANADKKNWAAATLEFAYNSNWSIFVNDMYNYGNDDSEKRIHYYNAGGAFTKGNTRIAASYGRQRGGLMCVGGVCRMVSEAAGLTLGISTSF